MSDLRHAIDGFDLESFVLSHGGQEHQRNEWTMLCPWCQGYKLIVSMRRRTWHCWRCQQFEMRWTGARWKRVAVAGAGGVIQLVMAFERCTRIEAEVRIIQGNIRRPGELLHLDLSDLQEPPRVLAQAPPIAPPPGCQPFLGPHPYLMQRGISEEDVRAFGLTWCAWGRYANRLIFPVFEQGALVYWQARAMWEATGGREHIKTLNPPRSLGGVTSAEVLFHLDQAVVCGQGRVCITEGPIDAIHAGYDAVCTFGKQISPTQVAKLFRAGVAGIDLMWDADAQADAEAVAKQLAASFDVRLVRLPHGDPGDWPREHLRAFRERAERIGAVSRLAQVNLGGR